MDDLLKQVEKLQMLGLNITDKYDDKRKKRTPIPQSKVKELLIRSKGKCEKCNIGLKGLKPDLHHKNQDPKDHRIANLIVLCPNCHRKAHYNKDGTKTAPRKRSKTSKATGKKKSNDILTIDFDIFGTNKKRGKKKKENEYDPFEGLY